MKKRNSPEHAARLSPSSEGADARPQKSESAHDATIAEDASRSSGVTRSPHGQRTWLSWAVALVLAIVTLAVYSQVRQFEFVNYDDPDYSTTNPHLRNGVTAENVQWAFTSSYQANWIPLTWISHMLDRQLFGWKAGADPRKTSRFTWRARCCCFSFCYA